MTYTERFEWIFKARDTNASALSERAGLARSHIRGILDGEKEGRRVRPGPDVLDAIARAANVSVRWLSSGKGTREPYEWDDAEPSTTPAAPPSAPLARDVERLIDAVLVSGTHRFSDAVLVREALLSAPPSEHAEQKVYVRRLLDTAAWHRERGLEIRPEELPSLAVVLLAQQLDVARQGRPPSSPTNGTAERKAS